MIRIAVAGGNIAGSTVLSMLKGEPDVAVVGVYEQDIESPGALLAQKWGIALYNDLQSLAEWARPEIIINVTGDTRLAELVRELPGRIEVIDTSGARFLCKILEKQKKARIELYRTLEDEKRILSVAENAQKAEQISTFSDLVLERALEICDAPAGSIALVEGDEMQLVSSKGLSKRFAEKRRWKILPEGLTDMILKRTEIMSVPDIAEVDYMNNPALVSEGIKAVLACPVQFDHRVSGILFIDDFKTRQFTERHKRSISLLARVAGVLFERISLARMFTTQGEELSHLSDSFDRKVRERTEELERINRELEKVSQHKSRFIANMSHELRTPLNSILGFSGVLLEKTFGDLTENQDRYVRNINASGRHLLELINNVLDIAKIEAGKYEMSFETVPVYSVMGEVFDIMKPVAAKKFVECDLIIEGDIDTITADVTKLKQILYNLLSNAIKFTPEGGKITVVVDRELGWGEQENQEFVRFTVRDTGIGISTEDVDRIFDEFEQADTTFSREFGGAGLGLALTKKLAELHGGHIRVESKLGEGSTFRVSIPQMKEVQKKEAEEVEAVKLNFPWMDEKAPLILVVEDDPASAELLTLHLTQAGYKVSHAFNGIEALDKARAERPFAILLDVMLPKKDGWEVLQSLKSSDETANIPVLIHSIIDNKDLAFALGATDYLMKPLEKDTLIEKLKGLSFLKGRKYPITLLVIESKGNVDVLKDDLKPEDFLIYSAQEGKRGIELATALRPDVILLDFELPDMLGFDLVRELKESPSTRNIPIFILTEKDISFDDRMSLVGKIERIVRKHRFTAKELIDQITEIEILYPKRAGLVDELTGIFSHRYFHLRLSQEVERACRYKNALNLMILDVDSFGQYVKEQGDLGANTVLRKISEILTKNIRGSDVVVRYGGDAFAIILPNIVLSAALSLANRFSAVIGNYPFPQGEKQPKGRVTVSVGMAFLDGQTPEELVLCCEKALTHAINRGGNRVEIYSKEWEEEGLPKQ